MSRNQHTRKLFTHGWARSKEGAEQCQAYFEAFGAVAHISNRLIHSHGTAFVTFFRLSDALSCWRSASDSGVIIDWYDQNKQKAIMNDQLNPYDDDLVVVHQSPDFRELVSTSEISKACEQCFDVEPMSVHTDRRDTGIFFVRFDDVRIARKARAQGMFYLPHIRHPFALRSRVYRRERSASSPHRSSSRSSSRRSRSRSRTHRDDKRQRRERSRSPPPPPPPPPPKQEEQAPPLSAMQAAELIAQNMLLKMILAQQQQQPQPQHQPQPQQHHPRQQQQLSPPSSASKPELRAALMTLLNNPSPYK